MLQLVDQVGVEVEVAPQEVDHEQEVLAPMGERSRRLHAVVEALVQVGELGAKRAEALARGPVADQVRDQESEQRLALERRERDRRGA